MTKIQHLHFWGGCSYIYIYIYIYKYIHIYMYIDAFSYCFFGLYFWKMSKKNFDLCGAPFFQFFGRLTSKKRQKGTALHVNSRTIIVLWLIISLNYQWIYSTACFWFPKWLLKLPENWIRRPSIQFSEIFKIVFKIS